MKLQAKFKVLEPTAFGPWLAAFKKLFTKEELDQDIAKIQHEINKEIFKLETEQKNILCKALVILSNNVEEVEGNTVADNEIQRVEKYKANINLAFTKITSKQMKDYYDFIIKLPKGLNKWDNYFQELEKEKGYNPTDAVKNVLDINKLVEKFANSQNIEYKNHYEAIGIGTGKLLEYLKNPQQEEVLVAGDSDITYGCDNV